MTTRISKLLIGTALLICAATPAMAHCQIPCGIFDDAMRFTHMREHVVTIEKSMKEIIRLEKAKERNDNQLVRWIKNKEVHAKELADIVTYYFMAQRVKPAPEEKKDEYAKYVKQVELLHHILVQSMKAKQTTDAASCTKLRKLIAEFEKSYMKK